MNNEERKLIMQKNPRIQSFSERVQKARYQNKENLRRILCENQNTNYGEKYGFANIRNQNILHVMNHVAFLLPLVRLECKRNLY